MKKPVIHCKYDELIPITCLKPHPKNPNKHTAEQIVSLAKILEYQGWRYPVNVSKQSGYVVSGHGRIEAARYNGWETVPVVFQEFQNEDQEFANVVSDNSIASWAELDFATINDQIQHFDPSFDLELLGIRDFKLDASEKEQTSHNADIPEDAPRCETCGRRIKLSEDE